MKKLIVVTLFLILLLALSGSIFILEPASISTLSSPLAVISGNDQTNNFESWKNLWPWPVNDRDGVNSTVKESSVCELALQVTAGLDNDYDKMVAVYDWVTANIAYDLDKANDLASYGSGSDYLLDKRLGVCHDYAMLTMDMLQAVGIEATYEKGEVLISSGQTELHAWNNVLIGEIWYALDTTWGSGLISEDGTGFIQKPRRLYLTSPIELSLLQSSPDYKSDREQEYLREASAAVPVIYLSDTEAAFYSRINRYRESCGINLLVEEPRLREEARKHASLITESICSDEDFSLEELSSELGRQAGSLKIKSAAMHALVKWIYLSDLSGDLSEELFSEQASYISEQNWDAIAIGAARKGDLVVILNIFIEYQ